MRAHPPDEPKKAFGEHFVTIMSEAATNTVVEFDGSRGRPTFNDELFAELHACVSVFIGQEQADELFNGTAKSADLASNAEVVQLEAAFTPEI